MAAFGLPPDAFSDAEAEPDVCIVDADNWPTVSTFLALKTQWRKDFAGMSGVPVWHGIRYTDAAAIIPLLGYQAQASAIFDGLRIMEAAALPLLNKQS